MAASIFLSVILSISAFANPDSELQDRIIAQGVPADAVHRFFRFVEENVGHAFSVPIYHCVGKPDSVRPCKMKERVLDAKKVVVPEQKYSIIVDYTQDSLEKRFYVIDMQRGFVHSFMAAHGKGSGDGLYAYRFGDDPNSKETALGVYLTGPAYSGHHGLTLRLYGLQRSNSNAYWRDIVFHGAAYMRPDFANKINPKTGEPFEREGVSWGCPAVDPEVAKFLIPLIENGALIYHYQRDLADAVQSGKEVKIAEPVPLPRRKPQALSKLSLATP